MFTSVLNVVSLNPKQARDYIEIVATGVDYHAKLWRIYIPYVMRFWYDQLAEHEGFN